MREREREREEEGTYLPPTHFFKSRFMFPQLLFSSSLFLAIARFLELLLNKWEGRKIALSRIIIASSLTVPTLTKKD